MKSFKFILFTLLFLVCILPSIKSQDNCTENCNALGGLYSFDFEIEKNCQPNFCELGYTANLIDVSEQLGGYGDCEFSNTFQLNFEFTLTNDFNSYTLIARKTYCTCSCDPNYQFCPGYNFSDYINNNEEEFFINFDLEQEGIESGNYQIDLRAFIKPGGCFYDYCDTDFVFRLSTTSNSECLTDDLFSEDEPCVEFDNEFRELITIEAFDNINVNTFDFEIEENICTKGGNIYSVIIDDPNQLPNEYSYQWSNHNQNINQSGCICEGDYSVTVTNNFTGCSEFRNFTNEDICGDIDTEKKIPIQYLNNRIIIQNSNSNITNINLYNLVGNKIPVEVIKNGKEIIINFEGVSYTTGVYILNFTTTNQYGKSNPITEKIYIH